MLEECSGFWDRQLIARKSAISLRPHGDAVRSPSDINRPSRPGAPAYRASLLAFGVLALWFMG